MMSKDRGYATIEQSARTEATPYLNITKLGIVSRDYRHRYANGYRDFSHSLPVVLELLDRKGCDAALFSLYSVVPRESFDLRTCFEALRNIKTVLLEEFKDGARPAAERYVVFHKKNGIWKQYEFRQVFASLTGMKQDRIQNFVNKEMPKRVLGNFCVLLCGESNGVKYSPKDKQVHDTFGLMSAIPEETKIILNPIHDRMTRFEMKLKRKFLSRNNRWLISVWNKGKTDKNGNVRDGNGPAWTVFHDEKEVVVSPVHNELGVEIGMLDINRAA